MIVLCVDKLREVLSLRNIKGFSINGVDFSVGYL